MASQAIRKEPPGLADHVNSVKNGLPSNPKRTARLSGPYSAEGQERAYAIMDRHANLNVFFLRDAISLAAR